MASSEWEEWFDLSRSESDHLTKKNILEHSTSSFGGINESLADCAPIVIAPIRRRGYGFCT